MNIKTIMFTILLFTAFVVTNILALSAAKKITTAPPQTHLENNPDFFMDKIVYTKFNREGEIRDKVYTNKIIHYDSDNVSFFTKPDITLYNPNEQPCHIVANHGKSEKGQEIIYLWENVKVVQMAGPNNSDLDITTTALTFHPETKFAETVHPITIVQKDGITKAVGAEANLKTGFIKLLAKVIHTKFDHKGDIKYTVHTDTMTHLVNDDNYFFEKPHITLYNPNEQPCVLTANHGKSEKGQEIIYLWENVKVVQMAGPNNSDLDITTTALTFYPEIKFGETKEPVTVIQDGNLTKAVGAKIDFKTGEITFLSKFEGLYQI